MILRLSHLISSDWIEYFWFLLFVLVCWGRVSGEGFTLLYPSIWYLILLSPNTLDPRRRRQRRREWASRPGLLLVVVVILRTVKIVLFSPTRVRRIMMMMMMISFVVRVRTLPPWTSSRWGRLVPVMRFSLPTRVAAAAAARPRRCRQLRFPRRTPGQASTHRPYPQWRQGR